jgi:hypothetical protein
MIDNKIIWYGRRQMKRKISLYLNNIVLINVT